jgi:hypothetical protein
MKPRGSSPEDLAVAPFIDDAERAESEWLIARENDPGAPAPSSKIASDHAEIHDLLGSLPLGSSDESWHDDVLKLASVSVSVTPLRRRPLLRWTGGALLAAAAAVVVVVSLRPRPPAPELEVAIHHGDPSRSDSRDAAVSDRLIVRARPRGASELRVYRADGPLVARCPDGPRCTTPAQGEYAIDITLDAPVQYHVILVVGTVAPLPEGTMDTYIDAARTANARIVTYQPIDVR